MTPRRFLLLTFLGAAGLLGACGLSTLGTSSAVPPRDAAASDTALDTALALDAVPPLDGAAPPDAGEDAADAPSDTIVLDGPPLDASVGPVTLAHAGSIADATGGAQQAHLVYGENEARWWLFAFDPTDMMSLETFSSPDFKSWTKGPALPLPQGHANIGSNLTVAYANVGGHDIVHVAMTLRAGPSDRRLIHARADLSGGSLTFGNAFQVSSTMVMTFNDPDAPFDLVGRDGTVTDTSGVTNLSPGNEVAWQSVNPEQGTSWAGGFGSEQDIDTVQNTVNARTLTALASGDLLAFSELADSEPMPSNVTWNLLSGGVWNSGANLFGNAALDVNDWAVCHLSDTDVHAVRRSAAGSYEHQRYAGSSWATGGSIPSMNAMTGGGLVMLNGGSHLLLVTLAADAATSVQAIPWSGSAWGAWSTMEGSMQSRSHLSAYTSVAANKSAVIWTQAAGGNFDIVGELVTF